MLDGIDNLGNVVFLKEADGSDAGGSSLEAGSSICESDSAQRENWHMDFAGLVELG